MPPYRITLERVSGVNDIVYNPVTEQLEFPNGLENNSAVTGVMVVRDTEHNKSELFFRVIRDDAASARTYAATWRVRFGWIAGYGDGATVSVNMSDSNTVGVPQLTIAGANIRALTPERWREEQNRDYLRFLAAQAENPEVETSRGLALSPPPPPFVLSEDQRSISVDPLWLTGVKHRDIVLVAELDGETVTLVLRLNSGNLFAFTGGHGFNARYVLNGVTDLAAINVPHTNFLYGKVDYRIAVSDPYKVNATLVEGVEDNQIAFGQISGDATIRYRASNGTDTVEILYDLRTAVAQSPDSPPEGAELRLGVTKTLNVLPVSRATVSRAGLRPVMRWTDPCVEEVDLLRYSISASQTRVFLPQAISGGNSVWYRLEPLGTTPAAQYDGAAHAAVLPTGPRKLRYRLVALSGNYFLSKELRVDIDPALREASPDYIADCDTTDPSDAYVIPAADTGAGEPYHFAGLLTARGELVRVPGSVVTGYTGLTPGAGYGVNKNGELCQIDTTGSNKVLMRAVDSTTLMIL